MLFDGTDTATFSITIVIQPVAVTDEPATLTEP